MDSERTKGRTRRMERRIHIWQWGLMGLHGAVMPPQGPFQCRLPEITVDLEGKMEESYC